MAGRRSQTTIGGSISRFRIAEFQTHSPTFRFPPPLLRTNSKFRTGASNEKSTGEAAYFLFFRSDATHLDSPISSNYFVTLE